MGEQRVVLEHHVHRALVGSVARDVPPAQLDPAPGRRFEPADHPQRGGLAAAARAEQREELPGLDAKRDPVDRDDVPKPFLEVDEADLGEGRVRPIHECRRLCARRATRCAASHGPQRCQVSSARAGRVSPCRMGLPVPACVRCQRTIPRMNDIRPAENLPLVRSQRTAKLPNRPSRPPAAHSCPSSFARGEHVGRPGRRGFSESGRAPVRSRAGPARPSRR